MRTYIILAAFSAVLFSCKKDNYKAPDKQLSGHFVYKGEAIQVEYDRVPFEIYDRGFGKMGPMTSTIAQDGSYSQLLYDGDYKLVVRPGQGPFMWPQTGGKADSLSISVNGNQTKDIEVMPYYMIRTPQIAKSDTVVTASFKLEKIITDAANAKGIERVNLYVNKTQFVSGTDNLGRTAEILGANITNPNNITMRVVVPVIKPAQSYLFARIGLKIDGVEDMIFSPVVKITL